DSQKNLGLHTIELKISMGKQPHRLTDFIIVLDEKANKTYSESEQAEILDKPDRLIEKDSDDNSSSLANPIFMSSQQFPNKKHTIDRYCLRPLKESAQKINASIQETAQKDTKGVILAYDNWKNIKKESIFGSILITSK
ncbi:39985_t:CDS:2, partial [Gigaspora margarita]